MLEPEGLILGQCVFDTHSRVGLFGRTEHVTAAVAVLVERSDRVGLLVAAAVDVEPNGCLALDERTPNPMLNWRFCSGVSEVANALRAFISSPR